MNMATVLMTSRCAAPASSRWSMMAAMGVMLIVAIAMQWDRHAHVHVPFWMPRMLIGYIELFVGFFLLAPALLLSMEAKQLRLPGVQLHLVFGLGLQALLWIAAPSLVLSIAEGQLTRIIAWETVGFAAGLALGLLPRVVTIPALFAPTALGLMHVRLLDVEETTTAECWLFTAALLVICTACWVRQLRAGDPARVSFTTPIALRMRLINRDRGNNWGAWRARSETSLHPRGPSQHAVASLRGSGPQDPLRSLRVGLGGWLMPRNVQGVLHQWTLIALPVPLFLVLLYLRFPDQMRDLWHALTFYGLAWLAGFTSVLASLMTVSLIQQRWSRANAELSLLALLPGLGHGPLLIKRLLRASLLPTMYVQGTILLALLWLAFAYHAKGVDLAFAVLTQLAALLFAPAFAFATLGGRPLPSWTAGLIAGFSSSLVGIGTGISAMAGSSSAIGTAMPASVLAGWLILLIFLCWLGQRGLRGLCERPHPFLPN